MKQHCDHEHHDVNLTHLGGDSDVGEGDEEQDHEHQHDDHLGGDSDVGQGDASSRRVPLGDVEKPLGGRAGLEEVAEETSNLEGVALWNIRRTIVV